jgi:hypothetical protein
MSRFDLFKPVPVPVDEEGELISQAVKCHRQTESALAGVRHLLRRLGGTEKIRGLIIQPVIKPRKRVLRF